MDTRAEIPLNIDRCESTEEAASPRRSLAHVADATSVALVVALLTMVALIGAACSASNTAGAVVEGSTSTTFDEFADLPIVRESLPTSEDPRKIVGKLNMIRDIAICGNNYELLATYYYRSSSNTAYQMDREYMDSHPNLNCMTVSGIRGDPVDVVWSEDRNSLSFGYTVSSPDGKLYDKTMTVERGFPGDNWLVTAVGNR